jgi:hypothetical protein
MSIAVDSSARACFDCLATLYHVMSWESRSLFLALYTPSSREMEGMIPPGLSPHG